MDLAAHGTEAKGAAQNVLKVLKPFVLSISHANLNDHFNLDVVRRASIRRQYEALEAIVLLVDAGKGELAVPLLRPACEEYLWTRYLNKIGDKHASALVDLMLMSDMTRTLEAQASFTPDYLGDLEYWLGATRKVWSQQREQMRRLGHILKWPKQRGSLVKVPTMRFIAEQAGELPLYEFLYFATSKAVHFNTHELTRRVWGKPPNFTMDAPLFRAYWSVFALIWGTRLFLRICMANEELVKDGPDESIEGFEEALKTLEKFRGMPIILAREFSNPGNHPYPNRAPWIFLKFHRLNLNYESRPGTALA